MLGAALDYMNAIGFEAIGSYEDELLQYANEQLTQIEGLRIYVTTNKNCCYFIQYRSIHPYDVGLSTRWALLFEPVITVPTDYGLLQDSGTIPLLCVLYTKDDVDTFVNGVQRAVAMLR